jgi:hypothetical protein
MPFSLISSVLGAGFALVWLFIGAMVIHDSQFAIRRDRESDTLSNFRLPTTREHATSGPHARVGKNGRRARTARSA